MDASKIISRSHALLRRVREGLQQENVPFRSLPGWLTAARCVHGKIGSVWLTKFEDSFTQHDEDVNLGECTSDTSLFIERPNLLIRSYSLRLAPFVLVRGQNDPSSTCLAMAADNAFSNYGIQYFGPSAACALGIKLESDHPDRQVQYFRYVSAAVYWGSSEFVLTRKTQNWFEGTIFELLRGVGKDYGDTPFATHVHAAKQYGTSHEKSVLLLGKYDGGAVESELESVRHALRHSGYLPITIKELPDIPHMALDQKVSYFGLACRFCIMIDEAPAGHLSEYPLLASNRCIIALLQKQGRGSTRMIGPEADIERPYIRRFQYSDSAVEPIQSTVEWAEGFIARKASHYDTEYPWRPQRP